jgi:hypothetical protein
VRVVMVDLDQISAGTEPSCNPRAEEIVRVRDTAALPIRHQK